MHCFLQYSLSVLTQKNSFGGIGVFVCVYASYRGVKTKEFPLLLVCFDCFLIFVCDFFVHFSS